MPRYNLKLQSRDSLKNVSKEIQRIQQALELRIKALEEDGITELEVRNNTILLRGLNYVESFVEAVREAHLSTRAKRGDYDAEPKTRKAKSAKAERDSRKN